tara:strand:- start:359 stop:469 length:111 start_codon:yes stop_codon:yes gene_type:complete
MASKAVEVSASAVFSEASRLKISRRKLGIVGRGMEV